MNMQHRPEDIFLLFSVSAAYLLLLFLLLRRLPTPDLKLLLLGLLTALLAVWCGQVSGGGERVVIVSQAAGTLGRIAFVLVLGGVAMSIVSRCASPTVAASKEEPTRETPV
jgi:hypothetical protein